MLRLRPILLLRRLYRLRLLGGLLRRLRPRVPLLWRQMLLLLGSLLDRSCLLALRLGPLLPIFLLVFPLLTEGWYRSIESEGQSCSPCNVKHSLLSHSSYLSVTEHANSQREIYSSAHYVTNEGGNFCYEPGCF